MCALCKVGRVEELEALFGKLLHMQWSADEIIWTVLIDGIVKEGGSDLCMKLLHQMESSSCKIKFHSYVILAREVPMENKLIDTSLAASAGKL